MAKQPLLPSTVSANSEPNKREIKTLESLNLVTSRGPSLIFSDTVQVLGRVDKMIVLRFLNTLPDGLQEECRIIVTNEIGAQISKLISNIVFPEGKKES